MRHNGNLSTKVQGLQSGTRRRPGAPSGTSRARLCRRSHGRPPPSKPALARQARAALAMDTLDLTFDPTPTRRAFSDLPETGIRAALKDLLEGT